MSRVLFFLLLAFKAHCSDLAVQSSSPLGFPTTLPEVYIPGPRVEVIPRKDNESSLVLRILEVKPAADGFRYTFEAYALDPGTHRLADFLRYAESREPVESLDATFEATTVHPRDTLPKPAELTPAPPGKLGGYRTLLIALGSLWLAIFLLILFYRKKHPTRDAPEPAPTLAEKLHALVTQAAAGQLSDDERARLERLILGHWKQKLPHLANLPPARALAELRSHPEASPLVRKLEEWLHAPAPDLTQSDLQPLLTPYLADPNAPSSNPQS